jgi:hypothetical protein
MSDNNSSEKLRTFTEKELSALIAQATFDLRKDVDTLQEKLRASELRACIAEWAVAGVLSRNLFVQVSEHGNMTPSEAITYARHVGGNAGQEFLHAAELHFKDHARHSELMSRMPPYMDYNHRSEKFAVGQSNWPRPYK